ncbi:MAG: hypothetical protein ABSC50_07335 [Candidatus Bathyarchaeia archaeon]
MTKVELGQIAKRPELSVNLEGLSDGELLELAVPSENPTESRRVLVIWLFLKESPKVGLEEFDRSLTAMAEQELERRARKG